MEQYLRQGLVSDSKVLDIRQVDVSSGKILENNVPVFVVTFATQEVLLFKNAKTAEIVVGAENRVEQCQYAAVITRVEDELDNELTAGWKVIEVRSIPYQPSGSSSHMSMLYCCVSSSFASTDGTEISPGIPLGSNADCSMLPKISWRCSHPSPVVAYFLPPPAHSYHSTSRPHQPPPLTRNPGYTQFTLLACSIVHYLIRLCRHSASLTVAVTTLHPIKPERSNTPSSFGLLCLQIGRAEAIRSVRALTRQLESPVCNPLSNYRSIILKQA